MLIRAPKAPKKSWTENMFEALQAPRPLFFCGSGSSQDAKRRNAKFNSSPLRQKPFTD